MNFICLAYHRVGHTPSDPYAIGPQRFAAQMAWLARRGYRALSLGEALAIQQQTDASPIQRIIALSFDDGYRDFLQHALPVLQRHSFRATLFVVAGRLGETADWPGAGGAPLLTRQELCEVTAEGIEVGAHGWQHRPFPVLDPILLEQELARTRDRLSKLTGNPIAGLAYPYGRTTPAVMAAVSTAGFTWAATARSGRNSAHTPRLALRRLLVRGSDRQPLFKVKMMLGYANLIEARMDLRRLP